MRQGATSVVGALVSLLSGLLVVLIGNAWGFAPEVTGALAAGSVALVSAAFVERREQRRDDEGAGQRGDHGPARERVGLAVLGLVAALVAARLASAVLAGAVMAVVALDAVSRDLVALLLLLPLAVRAYERAIPRIAGWPRWVLLIVASLIAAVVVPLSEFPLSIVQVPILVAAAVVGYRRSRTSASAYSFALLYRRLDVAAKRSVMQALEEALP